MSESTKIIDINDLVKEINVNYPINFVDKANEIEYCEGFLRIYSAGYSVKWELVSGILAKTRIVNGEEKITVAEPVDSWGGVSGVVWKKIDFKTGEEHTPDQADFMITDLVSAVKAGKNIDPFLIHVIRSEKIRNKITCEYKYGLYAKAWNSVNPDMGIITLPITSEGYRKIISSINKTKSNLLSNTKVGEMKKEYSE